MTGVHLGDRLPHRGLHVPSDISVTTSESRGGGLVLCPRIPGHEAYLLKITPDLLSPFLLEPSPPLLTHGRVVTVAGF